MRVVSLNPVQAADDDDRTALASITVGCPALATVRDLVREFADVLCHQCGEHLEPGPPRAATNVARRHILVRTMSLSSGSVEDHWKR